MSTNGYPWGQLFKEAATVSTATWTATHAAHGMATENPPILYHAQLITKFFCPCGAEHYEVTVL